MSTLQIKEIPESCRKEKYRLTTEYHSFHFFDEDEIAEFVDSDDDSSLEDDETYVVSSTHSLEFPSEQSVSHHVSATVKKEEKSNSFRSSSIDTRNGSAGNPEFNRMNRITFKEAKTNESQRSPLQPVKNLVYLSYDVLSFIWKSQ